MFIMFTTDILLKNAKQLFILVLALLVIWFYKNYEYQKYENKRQTENARQLRISDSLKFASQILSAKEMQDYLDYQNTDLKSKLNNAGIKTDRVKSLITHNYYYKDTAKQITDVSPMIKSIREGVANEQRFIDTSKCLTIKGSIVYDGDKLKVNIDDREFKNKTDAVAYWERREWKFLGIKTRFLGKRQFTAKVFDECGESRIINIEKKE
jgi:hypothetical protein